MRNRLGQLGRVFGRAETLANTPEPELVINLVDPAADVRERPSPPPAQVKGGTIGKIRENVGCNFVCAMILPQVHLRKPCYDFSFL